ncbi:MAG: InlB B-repeat-containing protein [Bacteroidales bacterium]
MYFKSLSVYIGLILLYFFSTPSSLAQNQNGTQQLINRGFEYFDNEGGDNIEPQGWNSFMSAVGSMANMGKGKRLSKENGARPQGKGQYVLRIYSSDIMGLIANGNVTTGRINMGSMTPTNAANHNFTDRGSAGFNTPFTSVPDSLVLWVKFKPKNSGDLAQIHALVHNNTDAKDPGTNMSTVVAEALCQPSATGNNWKRISVPFIRTNNTNDAQYILVSFTTNKTPGGGNGGDEVFFDDLLFVYNPTLEIGKLASSSFTILNEGNTPIEISFTITGTMSPNNLSEDNVVIAELSDKNGSFASPIELGRLTTNESGTINGQIPKGTPMGNQYRIRVRSTNYPLISNDNGKNIELFTGYTLKATSHDHRGLVNGSGQYKAGSRVTIEAMAKPGNHFVNWKENLIPIENADKTYSFILNENRNIEAFFDTNSYPLSLTIQGKGSLNTINKVYIHGSRIELQATPDNGYKFEGYYEDGSLVSTYSNYTVIMDREHSIKAVFSADQYTISTASNNVNLGTVIGGGSYDFQSPVTLTATPKPYCVFVAWLNSSSDTISKKNPYLFQATQTQKFTGVFSEQFYQVSLYKEPENGGNVSGSGRFSATSTNTIINLEATPNAGYHFLYWTKTGDASSVVYSENPYTALSGRITSNLAYTAHFERSKFTIQLSSNSSKGGQVNGQGPYFYQDNATITASAYEGYKFVAWVDATSGDTLSKEAIYNISVTQNWNIKAIFEQKQYPLILTINQPTWGTVRGNGLYPHLSVVHLEATPKEGYEFRFWSQGKDTLSQNNPFSLTLLSPQTIQANFSVLRKKITASAQPAIAGMVYGTGLYENGTGIELLASPNTGYNFIGWKNAKGDLLETSSTIRFKANKDTTLFAYFQAIKYPITLTTNGGNENGGVSLDAKTYVSSLSQEFPYNQEVKIYAKSKTEGYKFTKWCINTSLGDSTLSTNDSMCFTVNGNTRLTAYFSNTTKSVTAQVSPLNAGSIRNTGNHESNRWVELIAEAAPGYNFVRWENKAGVFIQNENNLGVLVSKDTSFKAIFEKTKITILTTVRPLQAGSTQGDGTKEYGSTANLTATANTGYKFIAWLKEKDTNILSTNSSFSFTLTENAKYIALFDSITYKIQIRSEAPELGNFTGDGDYKYLRTASLSALPANGSRFVGWVHATDTLKEPQITWIVKNNEQFKCLFSPNIYTFKAFNPTPQAGKISIIGESIASDEAHFYNYGTKIQIIATALNNYHFIAWINAKGEEISKKDTVDLSIISDSSIYAKFAPVSFSVRAESFQTDRGYVEIPSGNKVAYLQKIAVSAIPNYGYKFEKWTNADTSVLFSSFPKVEFTVKQDTHIFAHFQPILYTLNAKPNVDGLGFISGQGNYPYGTTATLKAEPAYGYEFSYWEINNIRVSNEKTYTFPLESNTLATAVFTPKMYKVELQHQAKEYGYTQGNGIYAYNSLVTIEAIAHENYFFREWQNKTHWVCDSNSYTFRITQDTLFNAIFKADTFDISLYPSLGGSAKGEGRYGAYSKVELSAKPHIGYLFTAWSDSLGNIISTENPYIFNVSKSGGYQPVFSKITYTVTAKSKEGGLVNGSGTYVYHQDIVLLAQSDSIYLFKQWILNGESTADTLFTEEELHNPRLPYTVNKPLDILAEFWIKPCSIEAVASPLVGGSVKNTGTYNYGSHTKLEAIAAEHYLFEEWTLHGVSLSKNPILDIEVTKNEIYVAIFKKQTYTVSLDCYPSKGATISGNGNYFYGDTVKINVYPFPNYIFTEWIDENFNTVSTNPTHTFIVNKNTFLTASLEKGIGNEEIKNIYSVNCYPNPTKNIVQFSGKESMYILRLYDLSGKEVLVQDLRGEYQAEVDISSLRRGLYIYQIEGLKGKIARGKLGKI